MARAITAWTRNTARTARMAVFGLAVLSLSACVERIRPHGYVPDPEDLDLITVGVDTRDTVTEILGAPSTSGIVDDSGYYYVRSQFRHIGPIAPKVVTRDIVAVTFDEAGVVTDVAHYGLEDGRAVTLSRRVTESQDVGGGILKQLLRNIGKFDTSSILK